MPPAQWIPFTPASEALLPRAWLSETWPLVSTALTRSSSPIDVGWELLVYLARAVVDPEDAWARISAIASSGRSPLTGKDVRFFRAGTAWTSKTAALYFVATRPPV